MEEKTAEEHRRLAAEAIHTCKDPMLQASEKRNDRCNKRSTIMMYMYTLSAGSKIPCVSSENTVFDMKGVWFVTEITRIDARAYTGHAHKNHLE